MTDILLNPLLFEEAAEELGGNPAFYEKEWFAIKLLELIVNFFESSNKYSVIFTGGTCLSKGYKIINRFSEDLDFIITNTSNLNKPGRSQLRKEILEYVRQKSAPYFQIKDETIDPSNNNKAFNVLISYPKQLEHNSLRPDLKLEMVFKANALPTSKQKISSIINELKQNPPETEVTCMSPTEISADKVSALTWKILSRNRDISADAPEMIRHLHDLAALHDWILKDKDAFVHQALIAMDIDNKRITKEFTNKEKLIKVLGLLKEDKEYAKEYKKYVDAMSFEREDKKIGFADAVKSFESIVYLIINIS